MPVAGARLSPPQRLPCPTLRKGWAIWRRKCLATCTASSSVRFRLASVMCSWIQRGSFPRLSARAKRCRGDAGLAAARPSRLQPRGPPHLPLDTPCRQRSRGRSLSCLEWPVRRTGPRAAWRQTSGSHFHGSGTGSSGTPAGPGMGERTVRVCSPFPKESAQVWQCYARCARSVSPPSAACEKQPRQQRVGKWANSVPQEPPTQLRQGRSQAFPLEGMKALLPERIGAGIGRGAADTGLTFRIRLWV